MALQEINLNLDVNVIQMVGRLFGFYGISTFVGYLMPNPFYTNNQFYFKQFSLEQKSMLTKTDYSEWANPTIYMKKKNNKIKASTDFSTGLNDCLENTQLHSQVWKPCDIKWWQSILKIGFVWSIPPDSCRQRTCKAFYNKITKRSV